MGGIADSLRVELAKPEFSEGYSESFLDAYIATQIKVVREDQGMTQAELAEKLGTKQTVISRIESIHYSSWNLKTLKKLARAFALRLKVSFEEYGTLPYEVEHFNRKGLRRAKRSEDPRLVHVEATGEAKTETQEEKRIVENLTFLANTTGADESVRNVIAQHVNQRRVGATVAGQSSGSAGLQVQSTVAQMAKEAMQVVPEPLQRTLFDRQRVSPANDGLKIVESAMPNTTGEKKNARSRYRSRASGGEGRSIRGFRVYLRKQRAV